LSFILGFAITVAIWLREVVSCHDFILPSIATFWVLSLVGIYHGRAGGRASALGFLMAAIFLFIDSKELKIAQTVTS